jgi:putative transcriptional regulator
MLAVILARRKMKARDLAERIGITEAHFSLWRTGKVTGVGCETLANAGAALQGKPDAVLDLDLDAEPKPSRHAVGEAEF